MELKNVVASVKGAKTVYQVLNNTELSGTAKQEILELLAKENAKRAIDMAIGVGTTVVVHSVLNKGVKTLLERDVVGGIFETIKDISEVVGVAGVAISATTALVAKYKAWQLRSEQELIRMGLEKARERGLILGGTEA